MTTKEILPNATTVLVLGICSVVPFFFPIGLITGILGIILSVRGRKMYNENPDNWDGYKKLNIGYILSILGLFMGGIFLLFGIIYSATHSS
jgi:hypothetical protein